MKQAYGINYRNLDDEAEICFGTAWQGIPLPKDKIGKSLKSLDDIKGVDEKYAQPEVFKKLYNNFKQSVKSATHQALTERTNDFITFAKNCRYIFNESVKLEDMTTRIQIHLLLEAVSKKYLKYLRKTEPEDSQDLKENDTFKETAEQRKKFFDYFTHADEYGRQGISIKTFMTNENSKK
jgi:hypothetical protein